MHPSKRLSVDPKFDTPKVSDGTACFHIIDNDGQIICAHRFHYPAYSGPLDTPEWFTANIKIAQGIADALSAAPNAAIEYLRQCQREAKLLQELAERPKKDKP
jgi:hypothetical protein